MAKVLAELQSQRAGESDEETYQRAMRDPNVAQIMGKLFPPPFELSC